SKWVKKNNLEKGDEINISEKNSVLMISCDNMAEDRTRIVLDTKDKSESVIKKFLLSCYRKGIDEIELLFGSYECIDFLKNFINDMMVGFEIIKHTANNITIRSISVPAINEFKNLKRRLFLSVIEYSENMKIILEENTLDNSDQYDSLIGSISRISNLCYRILVKNNDLDDRVHESMIVASLDRIGSTLFDFLSEASHSVADLSNIKKRYVSTISLLRSVYETHYNYSLTTYSVLVEKHKKNSHEIMKDLFFAETDSVIWSRLYSLSERIADLFDPILALNCNPIDTRSHADQ
ncbi:MAG: hypothetical protein ACLFPQ_01820, partial [Candidatus Woesearchaeota archaeon]